MLGQHRTGKSLRFVVQRFLYAHPTVTGFVAEWERVRGFPRLSQAEKHKESLEKQHPGQQFRIIDVREREPVLRLVG